MEVISTNDFLETRFIEYDSYNDFRRMVVLPSETDNIKGIIMCFIQNYSASI